MAKRRKAKQAASPTPRKEAYYRTKPLPEGVLGHVTIAGDPIEIRRVANLHSPDGEKCDGLFWPTEDRIDLEAHLNPRAEKQTLVHELWHAIRQKYEIAMSPEQDEALAGPIGNGFASALARWLPKGPLKKWEE